MTEFSGDIEQCLAVLHRGGIILYPTDTIWGIGCDATNPDAVKRIYDLKKRPDSKALIVLVADERDILKYVAAPDPAVFDFLKKQERPTTVIYDNAMGVAGNLMAEDGSLAIRICKDEFCRHLLKRFRKPIVSTSANISGQPSPGTYADISQEIKNGVDYIVQYRQNEMRPAKSSMIVRWDKTGPVILRS